MVGLACPSCGGAVVPDCACPAGVVSLTELRAGTGTGACVRRAQPWCMHRLQHTYL